MSNEKVSQLPEVSSALATDIIYAIQGGISVRETLSQVLALAHIPPFFVVSSTATLMVTDAIYLIDNSSLVSLSLPTTSVVGSEIEIIGEGSGLWSIIYGAGQKIRLGDQVTTISTGNLSSTNQYDTLRLMCIVENTEWRVVSAIGNFNLV